MRQLMWVVGVGAALALVVWLVIGIQVPDHVIPAVVLGVAAVVTTGIASRMDKRAGVR